MEKNRRPQSLDLTGAAIIGTAIGAVAVGAFAIGALAIGRLAIRHLVVGTTKLKRLEIEDLSVKRFRAAEIIVSDSMTLPETNAQPKISS